MASINQKILVFFASSGVLISPGWSAVAKEVLTKQGFALALDQAALTACELRKQQMNYKLALKTVATPVFQLVKYRYESRIDGIQKLPSDQGLIRYLGIRISQLSLKYCPKELPGSVAKELSAIKERLK